MNSPLSRYESLILAGVVLAALVLGGIGLFAVGDSQGLWSRQVPLIGSFPHISGVEVGTRVRVKGINVGQVTRIEQPKDRQGFVLVHMSVDADAFHLLGSDSRAIILGEGFIGSKVIELDPGTAGGLEPGAVIPGEPDRLMVRLREMADQASQTLEDLRRLSEQADAALKEAQGLVSDLRTGQGPTGQEVTSTLRDLQDAARSVSDSFGAMKNLPVLGGYVQPPDSLLVRPDKIPHAFVFEEHTLFDPGSATLTVQGRERLDLFMAKDFEPLKTLSGVEIVVAAYTNSGSGSEATTLTRGQAEAVKKYLMEKHKIHSPGLLFPGRPVTAVGMGRKPSPISVGPGNPPPRRIEIIVFRPPEKGQPTSSTSESARP
jgi:phospholipid/cholesterol/gamma-HCH transport system substrate-binding protein